MASACGAFSVFGAKACDMSIIFYLGLFIILLLAFYDRHYLILSMFFLSLHAISTKCVLDNIEEGIL